MRTAALLGIAGLAAFIAYCFRQSASVHATSAETRSDLRRWEGEGGAPFGHTRSVPVLSPGADGSIVRH